MPPGSLAEVKSGGEPERKIDSLRSVFLCLVHVLGDAPLVTRELEAALFSVQIFRRGAGLLVWQPLVTLAVGSSTTSPHNRSLLTGTDTS